MSENTFDPGADVMGDQGIPHEVVNLSARPSPYTMPQPRHRSGGADIPGVGDKGNRGATLIHDAHGPSVCKFAQRWPTNAASALEVGREVKLLPRYAGDGGFWAKRAEGPAI